MSKEIKVLNLKPHGSEEDEHEAFEWEAVMGLGGWNALIKR